MPTRATRLGAAPRFRRLSVGLSFGLDEDDAVVPDRVMGTLAEDGPRLVFEYDPAFIAAPLPVSPLRAVVKAGLLEHANADFDFLPGLLADSLPDYWGRLIQNRAFADRGITPDRITSMDRLSAIGHGGMGAITFEPVVNADGPDVTALNFALADVAAQAVRIVEGSAEDLLPVLRYAGGASGGARPKITVGLAERPDGTADLIANASAAITAGQRRTLPDGYTHWLVKFAASTDTVQFGRDVGAVEAAYAEMARRAGVHMPRTKLLTDATGARHFAIERFDRGGAGGARRVHMQSVSALIHASIRVPSLDYLQFLQLAARLTRDVPTSLEMLRRAAFNVFANNRDDHARNMAFLMAQDGTWSLAPAFDLMYSGGINGHHTTAVLGESLNPGRDHLTELAAKRDLPLSEVQSILAQVVNAVGDWPIIAREFEIRTSVIQALTRSLKSRR